jgi:predicted ATP-grasp superfamily ATP-dependent carboligase
LSARQTLCALGPLGYIIDVLDPHPLFCLARYSRFVRRCYQCPPFRTDPLGYWQFLKRRLQTERYDVLFPTHDQVYLLSRCQEELQPLVKTAVPSFAAIEKVQSKSAFARTLVELGIPHPQTRLVNNRNDLTSDATFPCYVKLPWSTAGQGVWLINDSNQLSRLADELQSAGYLNGVQEVLIQQPASGTLCVVQSVFDRGRLLAAHQYQALALGVGGSASARVSVHQTDVIDHLVLLGSALQWHGALMIDYLYDANTGPSYIDANPRIGETFNAVQSGNNLAAKLVDVAVGNVGHAAARSQASVRTHSLMMRLLATALQAKTRRALLHELRQAWKGEGVYHNSRDDITLPGDDPRSLIPFLVVISRLFWNPSAAQRITSGTVANYSLDAECAARVSSLPG